MTRADIRRAHQGGALTRARRGWYAVRETPPAVVSAARVGGALTCVSALRVHGAWTLDDGPLHVRVASGVRVDRHLDAVLHWTPERVGPGLDTVEAALDAATRCLDFRSLVVVVDSIANRRVLPGVTLEAILRQSARGRRALAALDQRAESGTETLVRLALRRVRIRMRSQVTIEGVGRVDLLIGDRLVVEVDGYEWHGDPVAFERDRARDRELVRRGYVVVRVSYRQARGDIDAVTRAVRDVVGRREHLWRAVHRAELSRSGRLIDVSSTNARDLES